MDSEENETMEIDVAAILAKKYPGLSGWEVVDNVIVQWPDGVEKPSQDDLESWWAEIEGELIRSRIQAERQARYTVETDPLFFKAMRGEIPLDDWEAAVEQIRQDLPYSEEF
ncbi:MAG: hypothetical protein H0S82_02160 [Anaerolineaceae bacterium]|nr:hypothetical protein [Anaerolineaceae bacterium]